MVDIGRDRLEQLLSALAEQLAALDATAHLVVIGGSGLVAIGAVERSTRDVDVVAIERDGDLVSADPLPMAVQQAAALVARDFGLDLTWINPGPTSLLLHGLPPRFETRLIERTYGPALRVSFAAREDQIFLKLYAWATRREPRDFDDLQSLDPSPDELRGAARWARTHNMPGPFDDEIAAALQDFGVEDEGRDV
jgi:hypothetical protein